MPLTSKGKEILANMEKTYGSEKKAKSVLYASKNAGKITGIDSQRTDADVLTKCADAVAKIAERVDAMLCRRKDSELIRQRTGHEKSRHDSAHEVADLPRRAPRGHAVNENMSLQLNLF